jgi:hypothetical protein
MISANAFEKQCRYATRFNGIGGLRVFFKRDPKKNVDTHRAQPDWV